jgi:hypothetical protein
MLAVVASFNIGDAIQQSMNLDTTFAKMGLSVKAAAAKWKNWLDGSLSFKDTGIKNRKIQADYDKAMEDLNKTYTPLENPGDILIDGMVNSFKNGKDKVSTAFENLIPETSFNFEKKLNRFNQNSAIKEGMKNQKIMNFSTLNPFGSTNLAKKDEPKTAKDIINKLQLEQQKKTNNILSRAVNTEGMTFA